jgi:ribonuclease P protein subunit POP4
MPLTPANLVRHELIGLEAEVITSTNQSAVGIKGTVIDETRETIVIETAKGEKRLAKKECTFRFKLPSGEAVRVDGKVLVSRPEDRIKKKLRKW